MDIPHIQNGYPGLAKLIGPNIDQGIGIFRQFAELNARNLLCMQAEILCLQKELEILTYTDEKGPDSIPKNFARSVWEMRESESSAQWTKILEIREKLDAYNKCLLQQAQIAKLDRANKHDLKWLTDWLRHEKGGNRFLSGCEFKSYDVFELPDLVSILSRASNDRFTCWLEEKLLPHLPERVLRFWREPVQGSEEVAGLSRCNLKLLGRVARYVQVVLSAAIPSAAVLALYFIDSLTKRLGAVAGFSCLFSLVLAIFTTARPVEIFTATAAFASVQVVFVGGTSGVGNGYAPGNIPTTGIQSPD